MKILLNHKYIHDNLWDDVKEHIPQFSDPWDMALKISNRCTVHDIVFWEFYKDSN